MPAIIKSMRREYIPLLAVYFTVGLGALSAVAQTIFTKDILHLSAETLIELAIYTSLPWSIKMVFGSLIDSVKLFGSNRKAYIILGQILILLGIGMMVDNASTQHLFNMFGQFPVMIVTGLLFSNGVVISDIVADVMAIELVPPEAPDRDAQLGMVQIYSRIAITAGGLIGSFATGPLAAALLPHQVFMVEAIGPVIAMILTLFVSTKYAPKLSPVNYAILLGGVGYGVFVILSGMFLGQEAIFIGSLLVISYMMKGLLKEFNPEAAKGFLLAMIAIFLFRVIPGVGPAEGWWYMNELGFDATFMGHLRVIANLSGLLVLVFLASRITNYSIFKVMLVLTGFLTLLGLPSILVFYKMTLGLSAKTVILFDAAMASPLAQLGMIPLGILVAKNAPAHARAAYISVTASLMNISLVGGDLITKYLNKIFVVSRTDFSQLGLLMIYSLAISTALSILGLVILKLGESRK